MARERVKNSLTSELSTDVAAITLKNYKVPFEKWRRIPSPWNYTDREYSKSTINESVLETLWKPAKHPHAEGLTVQLHCNQDLYL